MFFSCALAKNGSFGFAKGWRVFRTKPNVRWEKIKIQKPWLLGRLSDSSFVPSFYIYFCRSFLLCRLLGLQVTVFSYTQAGILTTELPTKN